MLTLYHFKFLNKTLHIKYYLNDFKYIYKRFILKVINILFMMLFTCKDITVML